MAQKATKLMLMLQTVSGETLSMLKDTDPGAWSTEDLGICHQYNEFFLGLDILCAYNSSVAMGLGPGLPAW
jgi:hypothetical protein